VPFPLTGSGRSAPVHDGQRSTCGCTQRRHVEQRWINSSPFAPPVQNGRFSAVSSGRIRGGLVSALRSFTT
jgi:hypothetical protein